MQKKTKFLILIFLIIIILVLISKKPKTPYNDKTELLLNNEKIENMLTDELKIKNSKVYMGLEDVKNILDNTIYYEEQTGYIIATGNKKLSAFKKDDNNIIINGSNREVYNMVLTENGKNYINISELEDVYNYEINYISNSNIVTIDNLNKKSIKANVKKNTKLKEEGKLFSKTIQKLKKGDQVYFLDETENGYSKIRTQNGYIGYIKTKALENIETIREDYEYKQYEFKNENCLEFNLTKKDISNFEKRLKIINLILQEAVKKNKIYVKLTGNITLNSEYERFIIEAKPMLEECGIVISQ